MKNFTLLILLVLSIAKGWTQNIEEITHREVNVHFNDSSIKANVLLSEVKKLRVNSAKVYYWHHNNSIKSNQGDYKGRLLDGNYEVITKDGALITKGFFKQGTKNGVWKKWNQQGQLISTETWLKGMKNGVCKKFQNGVINEKLSYAKNRINGRYQKFENGHLIEKRTYKNGALHGKQILYQSDTVLSVTTFKKGVVVVKEKREGKKKGEGILKWGNKDKRGERKEDEVGKSDTKEDAVPKEKEISKLEKRKTPFWKKDKETKSATDLEKVSAKKKKKSTKKPKQKKQKKQTDD
jgi:antitoxin component YwqK of YwqJK toxin-antitoxin module